MKEHYLNDRVVEIAESFPEHENVSLKDLLCLTIMGLVVFIAWIAMIEYMGS